MDTILWWCDVVQVTMMVILGMCTGGMAVSCRGFEAFFGRVLMTVLVVTVTGWVVCR